VQIKKHGIHQLIVIGLMAHTCIEATVRFAAALGYEVTVVKDATGRTASFPPYRSDSTSAARSLASGEC
jgi:nicotinamidase-related amidase